MDELFPSPGSASASVDSSLDQLVASLSEDLVDDFPASDPRWMESAGAASSSSSAAGGGVGSIGSSMSLLILHQLKDKQTAHEFYINFLKEVGLWDKVSGIKCPLAERNKSQSKHPFQLNFITLRGTPTPTALLLREHAEKTAAAISLRTIHTE